MSRAVTSEDNKYLFVATDTKGPRETMDVHMTVQVGLDEKSQINYNNLCTGRLSYDELLKSKARAVDFVSEKSSKAKTLSQFTTHIECDGKYIASAHNGFSIFDPSQDPDHNWKFHLSLDRKDMARAFDLLYQLDLLKEVPYLKVTYQGEASTGNGKEITIYGTHDDMSKWQGVLQAIEERLLQEEIVPGTKPSSDESIKGSQYFHYRIVNAQEVDSSVVSSLESISLSGITPSSEYLYHTPSSMQQRSTQGQEMRIALNQSANYTKSRAEFEEVDPKVAAEDLIKESIRAINNEIETPKFDINSDGELIGLKDEMDKLCADLDGAIKAAIEVTRNDEVNLPGLVQGERKMTLGQDNELLIDDRPAIAHLRQKLYSASIIEYQKTQSYQEDLQAAKDVALNSYVQNQQNPVFNEVQGDIDLSNPIDINIIKESKKIQEDRSYAVCEHVAAFRLALEENFDNPKPTTPYRGIGVKAEVIDGEGLLISEIFSADNRRFSIQSGDVEDLSVDEHDVEEKMKGAIITAIYIEGRRGMQKISDLLALGDEGLKKISAAFHADGEVKFEIEKDGAKSTVTCDNSLNRTAIYTPASPSEVAVDDVDQSKPSFVALSQGLSYASEDYHYYEACDKAVARGEIFTNYLYEHVENEESFIRYMKEQRPDVVRYFDQTSIGQDMTVFKEVINGETRVAVYTPDVITSTIVSQWGNEQEDIGYYKATVKQVIECATKVREGEGVIKYPLRIFFPVNDTSVHHWATGEICIDKAQNDSIKANLIMHDPLLNDNYFDYNKEAEDCKATQAFTEVLQGIFGEDKASLERSLQPSKVVRQNRLDGKSCGPIIAREMVDLFGGKALTEKFEPSAPDLRIEDLKNGTITSDKVEMVYLKDIKYRLCAKDENGAFKNQDIVDNLANMTAKDLGSRYRNNPFDKVENDELVVQVFGLKRDMEVTRPPSPLPSSTYSEQLSGSNERNVSLPVGT